jgi:hypothetical protein
MLKNLGYAGAYRDENISIGVLLENPADFDLEASTLVFSITLTVKNDPPITPEDFTFYIMDEADRLYNTKPIPLQKPGVKAIDEDGEPIRQPDMLICTDFRHEFLFQDLRIVFRYRPCANLCIVKLRH